MKVQPHEPWLRLAQANIILGENDVACSVLMSATDFEPGLWEIWRDLTAVSAKCEHFEKCATAYRKVLNLNPLFENEEILKRIVNSLVVGKLEKTTHDRVRAATCELLGKLTTIFPENTHFWSLLGVVIASGRESDETMRANSVKTISKSIEIIESPYNKWYTCDAQISTVLKASQLIVDCLVNAGLLLRGTKEGTDCFKIALNYIDSIARKLEDFHSDFLTRSVRSVFLNHYNLLKDKALRIKAFLISIPYISSSQSTLLICIGRN